MSHAPTIDDYTTEKVRELVDKTPASGKKRSLGAIAAVATLGSLLFGYDTGVVAGALPYMYMPGSAGGLEMTTFEEGWGGGNRTRRAAMTRGSASRGRVTTGVASSVLLGQ